MKVDYIQIVKDIVLKHIDTNQYRVFLFGSRAIDNHHEMSDIDVGVYGDEPLSILIKSNIENEIVESIVPFHVDLVDFSKVSDKFKLYALENTIAWS